MLGDRRRCLRGVRGTPVRGTQTQQTARQGRKPR